MIEQYNLLIILVTVVCGSIGAIVVTRNFSRTSPISNKIKRQYDMYIADLEATNKRLRGKVSQSQKAISISADEADDPFSAIGAIIDQIAPQLPPAIRPLLKNKKALDFITNYVQSNPDAIKGIVEKFTSKQGNNVKPQEAADQSTL
jgi:hypothetical protein|tara:strand:+ start:58 stop:498 length:441 start_codon:yes stop_codon:yes gene_type:complete